ncbi:MAG: sigma-70 family RNA polymerase sigma factor [Planctomycetota bacterium]|jgi:RNA polymerase sigma factor (TIGR02999 family)
MATTTRRQSEVTRLLERAGQGDRTATAELLPLVYDELRSLAAGYMGGERRDHTLQTTALVHETYLRLIGDDGLHWEDRRQFYALAGEAMRRILIEHARKRGRIKRGGDRRRVPLSVVHLATEGSAEQILSLDEAFRRLVDEAPEVAEIVRLRFFAGLSVEHTARALGVSPRTVNRSWAFARAWLYRQLEDGVPE